MPTRARTLVLTILLLASIAGAKDKHTLDSFDKHQLSGVFYAEGAAVGDLDGDGHKDVVVGPVWYRGPKFDQKYELYPPKVFNPKGYSDNFLAFADDIDRDGRTDVLVVGFPGKEARWYRNPGPDAIQKHWPVHTVLGVVDNESPDYADVTGDGRAELICMSGGKLGYATPTDDATKPWTFHAVSPQKRGFQRFTHGLGHGDLNGDGLVDLIEANGWWERPADWDGKTPWAHHPAPFGGRASQILVYDIDGDGDNDVVCSLNAHGYGFAWFEQKRSGDKIEFARHDIMTDKPGGNRFGVAFSQLHAMALADMDGDGLLDVVTGKRWWAHNGKDPGGNDPSVLYWFRLTRNDGKVEFIPEPIDNDSGVGTQVTVADVNNDKLPDVIVGNKKGAFVFTHKRRSVSRGEWIWANHPSMKSIGKTPRQTVEGMQLREGFVASLVAGEPEVHQPIGFTIDEKGRIWVAENYSYPDWKPTGNDKIVVLEDTDGDGYHEKRTVFYDKLNFVSGIEVGFGGVFVGSPPNLLFIPDRDGDLVPDGKPEVLLDGWGHRDTHETLNAFTWGPDGWLYGCHGIFTHSNVGKPGAPDSERQRINAGVWRYHPVRKTFEVFAHGTSNPWGVTFDEHGECFTTACVILHAFHIVPGGRYERQAGSHFNRHTYADIKTIVDHRHFAGGNWQASRGGGGDHDAAGGGHAHAGALVYLGDQFPAEYRGKLLMNNIHGNRMNMDVLRPKGSTFTASHGKDFMKAGDKWYRGLHVRLGPDGSVYTSDWYDPRACHQQKPDDRRNGRIYRISYGQPKHVAVDLSKKTDKELVELQTHKSEWYVTTARRLLMERAAAGHDTRDTLAVLARRMENAQTTRERLRYLWARHVVEEATTDPTLTPDRRTFANDPLKVSKEPEVRAWMLRNLADFITPDSDDEKVRTIAKAFALIANDPAPTVRRSVASALQRFPHEDRWAIGRASLSSDYAKDDADDPMIPLLIWYGIEPLVADDPARALALIEQSKMPRVNEFIIRRAAAEDGGLAALVLRIGATDDVAQIKAMLRPIRKALESRAKVNTPIGWADVYAKLTRIDDGSVRDDAKFLAVRFGDPTVFPELRKVVVDGEAKMDQRVAAIEILVSGRDTGAAPAFRRALGVPPLRLQAIRGLALTDDPHTPGAIVNHYGKFNAGEKRAAIATLAGRPSYATKLLEAIGAGRVHRNDLPLVSVRQMIAFNDDRLTSLIEEHWGKLRAMSADKTAQMDKWKTLLNATYMKTANVHNGRAVYNRACAACHDLHGEGGKIGPELTGSNRADLDYILENVLDPNAVIGADYQLTIFTLKDGRVVSGMTRGENDTAVTVQTADQQTVVAKDTIQARQMLPMSMMPEGLFAALQDSEVRDLVAYLASPRQVPLPGDGPMLDPNTGRVAGAAEGESLKPIKVTRGSVRPQPMTGFKADKWSGDHHLWWTDAKPGDELVLPIPAEKAGRYEIVAAFTKARDYAIVQLSIDGEPAGEPLDLFSPPVNDRSDVVSTGPISLGEHGLKPGSKLTVRIVGAHPDAEKRYMFAIDYLWLKPIQ